MDAIDTETSETIYVKGEGGVIHLMTLPLSESIQQRLDKGIVTRVNEDGSTWSEGQELVKPGPNDRKEKWVGWAIRVHGADPEAAEAMTKQDLIDSYNKEPESSAGSA